MRLKSIKSFEQRWSKMRKLAKAQLRDFEKDRRAIARTIRDHRLADDVAAMKKAIAHQKRVVEVIKGTKALLRTRDMVVKEGRRRGKLLRRALT
jgi:flagellar motility protein MotE (MotC chaperone)